jgi:RNA polymerase sigma-70 factor, ECF subfamily
MAGKPEREERFRRLVDADAYDAVWRYACRLSVGREDAEDLLQDVLAQAYQRLDQLRDESVVKGWLFAIARNLHLSRLRRERQAHGDAWWQASLPADAAQAETPVPTRVSNDLAPPGELRDSVREAVARLPGAQREAVELFHLEGLSLRECAAALGVSENNVKQRLWRARQSLLGLLAGSLKAGELERMF